MVRTKTMSNKISPGQCHNIGGQVSDILFASSADSVKAQEVADSRSHPFWTKFNDLVQIFLVKAEEVKETIIEWMVDLTIPAQPEFIVAEKFTKSNPNVKFWYLGDNFEIWFLPLTEKTLDESLVGIGKLRIPAKLAEMTPEQPAPRIATTSQIYWMILQQPRGEKPNGKNLRLLTNGYVNLFRALDKDGIERTVHVHWCGGIGWYVYANELENVNRWDAGSQVISRKSVLQTLEPLAPAA